MLKDKVESLQLPSKLVDSISRAGQEMQEIIVEDCVYRWRLEQEQKLGKVSDGEGVMDSGQVARFIQHYQRLTEHCLKTLPDRVNHLYRLDEGRTVEQYLEQPGARM